MTDKRREMIELLDGERLFERDRLKILLDNAFPSADNQAIADRLLRCFPCMDAVLSATEEELAAVGGMSARHIAYLICVGKCCRKQVKEQTIQSSDQFIEMLKAIFFGKDSELGAFYLVNKHGKIVKSEFFTSSSTDFVRLEASEVFRLFSLYDCYGIYIAHNHVFGAAYPSAEDDAMTKKLKRIAEKCGVKLCDHAIINSRGESFSYAQSGRLETL